MSKIRIYELAKRLKKQSTELLKELQAKGYEVKSVSSSIDENVIDEKGNIKPLKTGKSVEKAELKEEKETFAKKEEEKKVELVDKKLGRVFKPLSQLIAEKKELLKEIEKKKEEIIEKKIEKEEVLKEKIVSKEERIEEIKEKKEVQEIKREEPEHGVEKKKFKPIIVKKREDRTISLPPPKPLKQYSKPSIVRFEKKELIREKEEESLKAKEERRVEEVKREEKKEEKEFKKREEVAAKEAEQKPLLKKEEVKKEVEEGERKIIEFPEKALEKKVEHQPPITPITPSILKIFEPKKKSKRDRRLEKYQAKQEREERIVQEFLKDKELAEKGEAIFIREGITVKELSEKINVKVKDIIQKFMMRGILLTINQPLPPDLAKQICSSFGYQAEIISFEEEVMLTQETPKEGEKIKRAPVVTVMGHVDHGKSTLLEAIHNIDITSKEHGGITQHIGAYKVKHKDREFVFLDTPGHEAFTMMRARGAKVTDIVILVVAADDSVMPQTVEAIDHCLSAKVPILVAINKIDKPGAQPEKVKQDLMKYGIVAEEFGGDTVMVPISAKNRVGIDELLDMLSLIADMMNLTATPSAKGYGTVLESKLDRARGPVATVLVQDGTVRIGDVFLCGSTWGRVRQLFTDRGERVDSAGPSTPVEVLGFVEVPAVGSIFQVVEDEAKARQISMFRKEKEKQKELAPPKKKISLDNVLEEIGKGEVQELSLILKADVYGSIEAISKQLLELPIKEVGISIVHSGVGAITESDVLLASASKAVIIGFNVRPDRKALELAKNEGVEIKTFTVIYNLIDEVKQALTGMLKPIERESILGHAEVKEIFKISGVGVVAGCYVTDGKITRSGKVRVLRDNIIIYESKIKSLKRFKDDVSEVKEGLECGISIENFNDLKVGDIIEVFEIVTEERT